MRSIGPLLVMVVALTPRASGDDLAPRVDRAIAEGTRALLAAQSPDGAWRSKIYGTFKDGLSLTPSVLKAVAFAPTVEGSDAAGVRAAAFLARQVRPDGSIEEGPFGRLYPVYADSASTIALTKVFLPGGREAIDPEPILAAVRERELVLSTGIGAGIASVRHHRRRHRLFAAAGRAGGRAAAADNDRCRPPVFCDFGTRFCRRRHPGARTIHT